MENAGFDVFESSFLGDVSFLIDLTYNISIRIRFANTKNPNAMRLYSLLCFVLLVSCQSGADKPSEEKMKSCLTNELSNKAIVESFEQQDGLASEKDGVKYYEGYFNAEIKFISNYNNTYKAGERYKVVKGTISFMRTEKGWNCQSFDMSAATLIKIKDEGDQGAHKAGSDPGTTSSLIDSTRSADPAVVTGRFDSFDGQDYDGDCNGKGISVKINWKKDKTLEAVFLFTETANELYTLIGNNYTDGVLQLDLIRNDKVFASGSLNKSMDASFVTWSGVLSSQVGSDKYTFNFSRPR